MNRKNLSETELLSLILGTIQARERILEKGIGDDCAVLRLPGRKRPLLFTTDILNEEVHFRQEWTTPFLLGYKALVVNQSDIAAMGGRPLVFVVNLAFSKGTTAGFVKEFYQGLDLAARRYGGALAGGDLSRSAKGINLSIAMLGETSGHRPILRSSARPGDILCVAGYLGLSSIGLKLLSAGYKSARRIGCQVRQGAANLPNSKSQWIVRCVRAHLAPEPMLRIAQYLSRYKFPTAMMDVSDGLSIDLWRMCQASGTGSLIERNTLPGCPFVLIDKHEQEHSILHGGEDYALLFTLPRETAPGILDMLQKRSSFPIVPIGVMTADKGRILLSDQGRREPLPICGYDHFA